MIQQFECCELSLAGVMLITPFSYSDNRGEMVKDYSKEFFDMNGIDFQPIETIYIHSRKSVLRGLHFQREKEQPKLVRCISGSIWAAVVDLRVDSPTLGKWLSVELNQMNGKEVFVPGGFAFGTLALEDSFISCKCGEAYYAEYDGGIRWNDPLLDVRWPLDSLENTPIISNKDIQLQSFRDYLDAV